MAVNKKAIIILVIFLQVLIVIKILQTNTLTNHSLLCEEAKAMVYSHINKFKNKSFFDETFPDGIIEYEKNEPKFLSSGTYEEFYTDDSGVPVFWTATINSDNFRGKEYRTVKANNTKRVIVLGDSHAFGYALNDNETFSFNLEKILNSNTIKTNWEVLNLGGDGYNLIQKLQILEIKGLKYKPDVVILQYDDDDVYPQMFRDYEEKIYNNITSFFSEFKNIIDCGLWNEFGLLREEFKKYFGIDKLVDYMIVNPFNKLKLFYDDYNFSLIVISVWIGDGIEKEICEQNSWGRTNVNVDILGGELYPISKYETHFNSSAHRMIAEWLYNKIIEI